MGQRGKGIGDELRSATVQGVLFHGLSVRRVAELHGISRQTVWRWVRRYQSAGATGLAENSRRPHSSPARVSGDVEAAVLKLRRERAWGAGRIGASLALSGSTVHRVLCAHGVSKLRVPRKKYPRYEMDFPGELVHVDTKELVPLRSGTGPQHLFAALDGYSREVFLRVFPRANSAASAEFLKWMLSEIPYPLHAVMTDNAWAFTMRFSAHPQRECPFQRMLGQNGIEHRTTKPYHPRTNGKVERFFGTLARELLRVVRFRDVAHRSEEIRHFGAYYNLNRPHSAIRFNAPTPYRIQYFQSSPDVAYVPE